MIKKNIVIKAAKDKSAQVRTSAAFVLMSLEKSKSSIQCLENLAKDKNKNVRSWAKTSLDFLIEGI